MMELVIVFQLLAALSLLFAAVLATFRPQIFMSFARAFPERRMMRSALATILWLGFVGMLAGIAIPFLAFFASCISFLSAILCAIGIINARNLNVWMLPAILVILSILVAMGQPLGLKVIALPKADDLPFHPAAAHVVKTYDEGLWFEGITSGGDGTLYLSGNRNLDFSRGDYYRDAQGELIARKSDGSEHIVFRTPKGFTSGVPLLSSDRSIYLTSHGNTSCIWHIDCNGKAAQLARFPAGAWPNGLDQGPDGMLYTPDSALGCIWRIDPKNGRIEKVIIDPALSARAFISLAPGANGLHFKGRDIIVTVSDRTTVLRYVIDEQGKFSPAKIIAKGIPGDDFAIGPDGSLFIATHPYNTVVRVSPGGERIIIGKMDQHIVGATDAVFGRTTQDMNTLYVVTDGGAFTGGPKTRGQLVALHPF